MALLLSWLPQLWQELHKIPLNPLLSLLFLFSFLYFLKRALIRSSTGKPNFPPSPPKLPIIGHLHQLGTLPHHSFQALSKKYGPIMLLYLGHAPTVVISSAELAREVLKTHDAVFANRPHTTAAKILLYGCTDMGFSPYGEYWRQLRKICVLELLSLKRVLSFQYVREEEVASLMHKIRESCAKQNSVNLSEMIIAASNNVISRCTLGQKFEQEDGKESFGHLARRLMVQLTAFCFGDFFPYLGWLDVLTGFIPSLKATFRELDTFFDHVIEEHKTEKCNDEEPNKKDFVHILLQLQRDGMLEFEFTDDNLKANLLDMFVAGNDTTSATLEWLIAELIKNPNIMKKAQDEVRRVVGKKSKIDANDIIKMDYLKCVINETLRRHPPTVMLSRETSSTVTLAGYDIPPKVRVFINTWAIHMDPTVWERPEEFLPERFIDNSIDFRGQYFEFLPFGGGRRGCPGLTFGLTTVEFVIANLLCWFDWKLPGPINGLKKDHHLDMSEVYSLVVTRKTPIHLVPILHSP